MDTVLLTLAWLALAFAVAIACGYGLTAFLMPRRDGLGLVAVPVVGYASLSLLAMVISGNLRLAAPAAVMAAFGLLALLSMAALVRALRRPRDGVPVRAGARVATWVLLPTLLVALWPTLLQGPEVFVGSANLDFYQSLMYQELLRKYDLNVFSVIEKPQATAYSLELAARVWPAEPQARFGAVMFSMLLESLTGAGAKASLTVSIAFFALCLPLSVFVFARVLMGLPEVAAVFAAILAALSASLNLGYLFVLVGQGSGLPLLPLLVAALYMALREPSARAVIFAGLLAAALFWIYAMMLPFAFAPMGLLALYLLATRRVSVAAAAGIAVGVAAVFLAPWAGMPDNLAWVLQGLAGVSGRLIGTHFFADFLSEMFFVYFLGVTSYPASHSLLESRLESLLPGSAWFIEVALAGLLMGFVAASLAAWWRAERDGARRVAVAAIWLVYACVWFLFTFVSPYGYSAFKMASWLQFAVLPVMASGLLHFAHAATRSSRLAAVAATALFVGANLVASTDYAVMSLGQNRQRGYVVNAFGMGNPAHATLGRDLQPYVDRSRTLALGFTDAIQNYWAAYRVMGLAPHAILSHERLPDDDAYLPNPATRVVVDSSGEPKLEPPLGVETARSDFYLFPGTGNLNPEIVRQRLGPAVWSNDTFRLHAYDTVRDYVFLGRGFYRAEYVTADVPWWQPRGASRWMRNGGEFYLLNAARPGQQYRLAFTAMVGFGYPASSRTLEFWHGPRKFGEMQVHDVARLVSPPFLPQGGIDKITVVIRETPTPLERPRGLWRRTGDTRLLNLLVSDVQLLGPDSAPAAGHAAALAGTDLLDKPFAFDGLSAAGWIGATASITLVAPHDRPVLRVRVMIPGNLGYRFPFSVEMSVDGKARRFEAKAAGPFLMEWPLESKAGELVAIGLTPAESRDVSGEFARRNRPMVQGMRLESVELGR